VGGLTDAAGAAAVLCPLLATSLWGLGVDAGFRCGETAAAGVVVENCRERARVRGCRHFQAQMALRAGCERNIVCDVIENESSWVWWETTAAHGELRYRLKASGHLSQSDLSGLRGGESSALDLVNDVLPVPTDRTGVRSPWWILDSILHSERWSSSYRLL